MYDHHCDDFDLVLFIMKTFYWDQVVNPLKIVLFQVSKT